MTLAEFLVALKEAAPHFKWGLVVADSTDKRRHYHLRAWPVLDDQRLCCPVTAVVLHRANEYIYPFDGSNAHRVLGLPRPDIDRIMQAADDRVAHDGMLRRLMLDAVGLKGKTK